MRTVRTRDLSLLLLLAAGCDETFDQRIGGDRLQCESRQPAVPTGDAAVDATLAALVPASATVRCADSTAFDVDGAQVELVFVAYGALNDCPAGCFTSQLCAIHDAGEVLLYSAGWIGAAEQPVALPAGCPSGPGGGDTRTCEPPPPGTQHPVTGTAAFTAFRDAQVSGHGDWRVCFL